MQKKIEEIGEEAGVEALAVSFHDYESRASWDHNGDRWFHAASTIKVPILAAVMGAVDRGMFSLESRLHVRNRFHSVADGGPFRVESARDSNSEVHQAIGKTLKIEQLAFHMIVTSSNLATNLLIELVGIEKMRELLAELELEGIELRRGVEDERAYEQEINNRVTASGMVGLLRKIEEGTAFSVEASARMLEILHEQEFRSGIPAGVPESAKVANKTGEISTVSHDAGIVYLPGRRPYVLVVLTEWDTNGSGRKDTIANVSRAVYQHLAKGEAIDD
ncbi:MAG TPA: serine hydrolase [Longimicrobiaceae bacterium]|nr:serine hydrolase [Longimicrobiaceae bacterium]